MKTRWLAFAATGAVAMLGVSTALYAQGPAISSWSGVYTAAQADHGRELFDENCAKCHQSTLEGKDEIPPLKGSHFMANWNQQTLGDLMERIHNTMPMDNPGALNVNSSTDVVAYLMKQNGMPTGAKKLESGLLTQFRIDQVKPEK